MGAQNVIRYLAWYERDPGGKFVGRTALDRISLEELACLFGVPPEELSDCFPVNQSAASKFRDRIDAMIDLEKFDYFVEFYSGA